jgi:hypothetical protein
MIVPFVAVRAFFARIRVNNFIAVEAADRVRSALDRSAILPVNTRSVRNSDNAMFPEPMLCARRRLMTRGET